MLRKLRGSESPAPVPSYLYSPLVPPYFCAYIVFEISTKVNFCFINFDASSLPAFSPILRLFIWDILADSAIMVKSVRLCRTEPAIFKEDIIMSKIVNEAKIGHLRSGLLPLLPDVHSEPAPHPFNPRHQRPLPTAERVVVFHHLVVAHAGRTRC